MKKLLVFVVFFASFVLNAQDKKNMDFSNTSISGTVLDSLTGKPIEYANIVLYSVRTSKLTNGCITDVNGAFKLEKIPFGKYYIEVNFIGYSKLKTKEFFLSPKNQAINFSSIKIMDKANALTDVVVTGKKEMMEFKLDKRVFNVDEATQNSGGTAADILQNVPSVNVDVDGNVSLRGNTSVNVMIDGKPVSLLGMSNSDAMDQIPASSIEKVEVVTNPSAKYDPDGTTGIINIITKKDKIQSYAGLINLSATSNDKYAGSTNLSYRINKFNFNLGYDFRRMSSTGNSYTNKEFYAGDSVSKYTNLNSDGDRKGLFQNMKFASQYFIDDFNTLMFNLNFRGRNMDNDNNTIYKENSNSIYNQYSTNNRSGNNISTSLAYRKEFDKKDHTLDVNVFFSKSNRDESADYYTYYPKDTTKRFNDYNSTERNLSGQVDYSRPLSETSQLDMGLKINSNYNTFDNKDTLDSSNNKSKLNSRSISNKFEFTENIYAGYVTYSNSIDKFKYQVGTRIEQAHMDLNQKTQNNKSTSDYFNLFPSVHLSYELMPTQSLQLSYSRRINRPREEDLNPYVDSTEITSGTITKGNKNLSPEYINSYEFALASMLGPSSVNTCVYYRTNNNGITQVTDQLADGTSIIFPINTSKQYSYGVEVVSQNSPVDWIRFNLSFNYFKAYIEGSYINSKGKVEDLSNDKYSWSTKLNSTITFMKGFDAQFNLGYSSPTVTPQGETNSMVHSDITLKKSVYEDKAFLTLRVMDPFNLMKMETKTNTAASYIFTHREMNARSVFLGFSFKLNDFKRERDNNDNGRQEEEY